MMLHSSSGATAAGGEPRLRLRERVEIQPFSPGRVASYEVPGAEGHCARAMQRCAAVRPEAKTAVQSASAHMPATAASGIETFNGTATAPARTIRREPAPSRSGFPSAPPPALPRDGQRGEAVRDAGVASASSRQLSEARRR